MATVLVTGGTGGLGAAVTRTLLERGWRVVVPWVAEHELSRLDDHERLHLHRADLFEPESVRAVVDAAGANLKGVVALVGGFAAGQPVAETDVSAFEEQLRLNLRPLYLTVQAALPVLKAAGGGSIVCAGSRAALRPFAGAAGYCASKAAVATFAQVVALEGRPDRIRCNAILPSMIDTPANRQATADARGVPPEEIARVIAFLLSDDSAPTSGAAIPVYGDA